MSPLTCSTALDPSSFKNFTQLQDYHNHHRRNLHPNQAVHQKLQQDQASVVAQRLGSFSLCDINTYRPVINSALSPQSSDYTSSLLTSELSVCSSCRAGYSNGRRRQESVATPSPHNPPSHMPGQYNVCRRVSLFQRHPDSASQNSRYRHRPRPHQGKPECLKVATTNQNADNSGDKSDHHFHRFPCGSGAGRRRGFPEEEESNQIISRPGSECPYSRPLPLSTKPQLDPSSNSRAPPCPGRELRWTETATDWTPTDTEELPSSRLQGPYTSHTRSGSDFSKPRPPQKTQTFQGPIGFSSPDLLFGEARGITSAAPSIVSGSSLQDAFALRMRAPNGFLSVRAHRR